MYWACARTQLRRELVAVRFLAFNGYHSYYPRIREKVMRRGRRIERVGSLFPGYVFVGIEQQWSRARYTIGVISLIMDGERPAVVADRLINEIRAREIKGAVELPKQALEVGDRVRVLHGPFRETIGLFAGQAAHERIAILLSLFGSQRRIELAGDDVEAV
jgi:transcriptional antiterminator RfaH